MSIYTPSHMEDLCLLHGNFSAHFPPLESAGTGAVAGTRIVPPSPSGDRPAIASPLLQCQLQQAAEA